MAHYIIARKQNDVFTVTRFSDTDIPDHIGLLDNKNQNQKLKFNFFYKATSHTLQKYLALVNTFIKDGEPPSTVYFVSDDVPPKVTSHCYGVVAKPKPKKK